MCVCVCVCVLSVLCVCVCVCVCVMEAYRDALGGEISVQLLVESDV